MKQSAVKILAALLLLAMVTGIPACGPSGTQDQGEPGAQAGGLIEVSIGFPSAGGNFPGGLFGVAIANGYLDEYLAPLGYVSKPQGFVGAAPAIHEALVAKELDYVVYAGMAADLSKANGIEHTLISVTGFSPTWVLIAGAESGITSLSDLKGKKIAYQRGASPHMYAIRVLAEAGLTFDDIEPLNMTIPEGIAGITTGDVDAAVVVSGQELELAAQGVVSVVHSGFSPENVTRYSEPSVFIARTGFHTENPDVAVAIQKAFLKAKDWALEDPERYFSLLAEQSGQSLEYVRASQLADIDAATPLSIDDPYIESLKEILSFLQDNELTSGDIDFETWLDRTVTARAAQEYADENDAS